MKIKKLFLSNGFPYHLVIETITGEYKKFYILPSRNITEADLTPVPYWKPVGKRSEEAPWYMYKMYGFEK